MAKPGHPASPGTRASPRNKAKRRARTSNNDKPETPSARAKRKRNAATARAKAAAGNKRAKPKATSVQEIPDNNAKEHNPEEVIEKPPKRRIVPPPGKKRKQGRWDTIVEEIDDDSTYSSGDEEEDESIDSEDGKEKRGADDNLALDESSSDNDDSGASKRMERFERDIAETHAEMDRRREELNRRAQQGAEDPPNDTTPAANIPTATRGRDAGLTVPRGMSNAESITKREKHVATRIIQFVKSELFRRIKFVNSAEMFQNAFVKVLQFERVPPNNHVLFQLTYESCFNKALNTKRSSCEQSGAKIAWKAIADFKKRGEDFFTIEEFCKLRRATTEREKRAFFWFFDSFLECVCGANTWRKVKKTTLVSEARGDGNCKIVTKSDEAFALLLIDNYLEKWETILEAGKESADTEPVNNNNTAHADGEANGRQKKRRTKRLPGKYTEKKSGHCKYGGWSRAGMARFNQLYKLVHDDRASPQSEKMERELLAFCRTQAGMSDKQHDEQQEGGIRGDNAPERMEAMPIEAAWDSDND
jgi:hypothetical protein